MAQSHLTYQGQIQGHSYFELMCRNRSELGHMLLLNNSKKHISSSMAP